MLSDKELDKLVALIRNSFRVRPNHNPVYVDVAGNLDRVAAPQHLVVFGRRGSGKSCLLVHYQQTIVPEQGSRSVYINCDEIKRLGYPDLLVRLLIEVIEGLSPRAPWWRRPFDSDFKAAARAVKDLREHLDRAHTSEIVLEDKKTTSNTADLTAKKGPFAGAMGSRQEQASARKSAFKEEKLDYLERHLGDFKRIVQSAATPGGHATVVLDDFYLLDRGIQPDCIDYVHRLLRGLDVYFKVGTVRHKTTLMRSTPVIVGVDTREDIESLDLDRTLEDTAGTQMFLESMLNSMGATVGIESVTESYLNTESRLALAVASGGVPRDYLTILQEAITIGRASGKDRRWLTPTHIWTAASGQIRPRLENLRSDAGLDALSLERVFRDLLQFCLKEKKKTAFLVSHQEAQANPAAHQLIQQLMDFKLIHVIETNTSAASGRVGRFEAYTLDFALFMSPRLRGIEHVDFWKVDDNRRKEGVREAPLYSLDRALAAASGDDAVTTESAVDSLEAEIGVDAAIADE